ncbi:MAG: ATP-binding protein, partial [Armatimonadetes bacterium]|nr:ATP-binding protein [Armatimonadota bacterium]
MSSTLPLIEMLKSLILDAQSAWPDTGTRRSLALRPVAGKATVCIGVRRCGKSTLMLQEAERLEAAGVRRENVLHVNLFDDRLRSLREHGLQPVLDAYFDLYPGKKHAETVYCFFDEIQTVPEWESFVDRILRTEKCRVYLTGSSAHMLSREIATQMRGRAVSWELFPFSFREFLRHRGIRTAGALSSRNQVLVRNAFEQYMEAGGFPEVADVERPLRVRIHQEYLQAVLFRDMVERHDIAHPRAVVDLAHRLLDNVASAHSINSLTGALSALGHRAPKTAVADYVRWFEDAYFIFLAPVFDASITRRTVNPRKAYCIDHALVESVSAGILANTGHLLENVVYVALRRLHPEVYYYKTSTGREVDFAVPVRGGPPELVQVCADQSDPKTRARETAAIAEAMKEVGADRGTIVTRGEIGEVAVETGLIRIVPCWRYL